jgi:hypothetical protein
MTEQQDTQVPEREIEFQGRAIWVKMPGPEQLLVWQRTVTRLQSADVTGWNGDQVMSAMERARKIIDSVILNQVDKDWLDDQMLDGAVRLQEASGLITQTVEAFAEDDNRASRRAAAKKTVPAKKAVRKKAAPRA